jgi:hypothetical protein
VALSPENANDVTKALAAFGAPSIRYHSFGQGQVRPSSVVMPRREVLPPVVAPTLAPAPVLPPVPAPSPQSVPVAPPLLRQPSSVDQTVLIETRVVEARVAATQSTPAAPLPMPPVPAFRRTVEPAVAPPRAAPMPPPRPLIDRLVAPSIPAARSAPETPSVTSEFISPTPTVGSASVPTIPEPPVTTTDYYRRPAEPGASAPLPSFEPSVESRAGSSPAALHTLKEIFAFLASASGAPRSYGRADPITR